MSDQQLPVWVWDLLADLVDEEDTHPSLYWQNPNSDVTWTPWEWCPSKALDRVPPELLRVASHIANYRRAVAV